MEEPNDIIQEHPQSPPQALPQQHAPPPPIPLAQQLIDTAASSTSASTAAAISTTATTESPPAAPLPQRSPNRDLLDDDRRRDFIEICVPLSYALMTGDWKEAERLITGRGVDELGYSINTNFETILHVAASAQSNTKSINFVENLVEKMNRADLELLDRYGNTALFLAITVGNVKIAEIMVLKNENLLTILNGGGVMPLNMALLYENLEMVNFLYQKSQQLSDATGWTPLLRDLVFLKFVEREIFDLALEVFAIYRDELAQSKGAALGALARNPSAFNEIKPSFIGRISNSIFCSKLEPVATDSKAMLLLREIWKSIEAKPAREIDDILKGPRVIMANGSATYPSRVLFVGAEMGNIRFLVELIRKYPDLICVSVYCIMGLSPLVFPIARLVVSLFCILYIVITVYC